MVKMKYAIDKQTGKKIDINADQVNSGKNNENYICFCCKSPVIAKKGEILDKHFSHQSQFIKSEKELINKYFLLLNRYNETVLHKKAKEYIKGLKEIIIPGNMVLFQLEKDLNNKEFENINDRVPSKKLKILNGVNEEMRVDIQPDIILTVKEIDNIHCFELFIEIYVSHKVDEEKKLKIKKNNQNCIEINLSKFDKEKIDDDNYFRKEIHNLINYNYINLSFFEEEKIKIQNKYLAILYKHNQEIIKSREKFIKFAYDENNEIKHISDVNNSQKYSCICCGDELLNNLNNYYHLKINDCIIFNKKKSAGIQYSQKLFVIRFFMQLDDSKIKIGTIGDVPIKLKKIGFEFLNPNWYIEFSINDYEKTILFRINFDSQDFVRTYLIENNSVINLQNWNTFNYEKNLEEINFTDNFKLNLEQSVKTELSNFFEQEKKKQKELNSRTIELKNTSLINFYLDEKNNIIEKKDFLNNLQKYCLFCHSKLGENLLHLKTSSCMVFSEGINIVEMQRNKVSIVNLFNLFQDRKNKRINMSSMKNKIIDNLSFEKNKNEFYIQYYQQFFLIKELILDSNSLYIILLDEKTKNDKTFEFYMENEYSKIKNDKKIDNDYLFLIKNEEYNNEKLEILLEDWFVEASSSEIKQLSHDVSKEYDNYSEQQRNKKIEELKEREKLQKIVEEQERILKENLIMIEKTRKEEEEKQKVILLKKEEAENVKLQTKTIKEKILSIQDKEVLLNNMNVYVNNVSSIKINSKGILTSFVINGNILLINLLKESIKQNSENFYVECMIENLEEKTKKIEKMIVFSYEKSLSLTECFLKNTFCVDKEDLSKETLNKKYLPKKTECIINCQTIINFVNKQQKTENDFLLAKYFIEENKEDIIKFVNKDSFEYVTKIIRDYEYQKNMIQKKKFY